MLHIKDLAENVKHKNTFPISYSKIRTFWECKPKFYRKHVLKEKSNKKVDNNYELQLGSLIHKVLERCVFYGENRNFDIERINFNSIWNDTRNSELFSDLEGYGEYITELYKPTKEAFKTVFNYIYKNNYTPKTEYRIIYDIYGNLTRKIPKAYEQFFNGSIDLFLYKNDKAVLIDYKKCGLGTHDAVNGIQLDLYAYLIMNSFPNINRINTIDYYIQEREIEHRKEGVLDRSKNFSELEEKVEELILKYIEGINSLPQGIEECTGNEPKCDWCEFKYGGGNGKEI